MMITNPKFANAIGMLLLLGAWVPLTATAFQWAPPSFFAPTIPKEKNKPSPIQHQESNSALRYRDHVIDEEGVFNALQNTPSPTAAASVQQQHQKRKVFQQLTSPPSGVQMDVIRNLAVSQTVVLAVVSAISAMTLLVFGHPLDLTAIHWNLGNEGFQSLFDWNLFSGARLLQGVVAAVPVIFLSSQVEHSDERAMSRVNFSTMNMVMSLFGRRQHNDDVKNDVQDAEIRPQTPMLHTLALSAFIALISAVSEEVTFRGLLPAGLFSLTHSVPAALLGQAVLFGIGHVTPRASKGENAAVASLQSLSGLWYGMVYLFTGGDVVPAILAHFLYDLHVFMETWMHTNDQMDYTEEAVLQPWTQTEQIELRRIVQQASLSVESLALLRRFFYAFDNDRVGSLSRSDVQRAMSYATLQDDIPPTQEQVDAMFERLVLQRNDKEMPKDRLQLHEFLRMILYTKMHRRQQQPQHS